MPVEEYQENIRALLHQRFDSASISEWRTQMEANIYSPRIDVAVGPFAIANGVQLTDQYDQIFDAANALIQRLALIHLKNLNYITADSTNDEIEQLIGEKMHRLKYTNYNPRCFLAVEIENEVTRKHLMGGALNACALGRIAIAIGYSEEKHRAFLNLYRYFRFLQQVEKPTFNTNNLLVISRQQFIDVLTP